MMTAYWLHLLVLATQLHGGIQVDDEEHGIYSTQPFQKLGIQVVTVVFRDGGECMEACTIMCILMQSRHTQTQVGMQAHQSNLAK